MLDKAIALASEKFLNIIDKGGKPYILHCLWVMVRVRHQGEDFMTVAVLHDIIEDTNVTAEYLLNMGFKPHIVKAIDILTKKPNQNYDNYIKLVKSNDIAREVKKRDLEHNSKITRLKGITDADIKRMIKYNKAYLYLTNTKL